MESKAAIAAFRCASCLTAQKPITGRISHVTGESATEFELAHAPVQEYNAVLGRDTVFTATVGEIE